MDVGLAGSVALVTGGVRGVGRGIVEVLHGAGAAVVTCARHEPEQPREGVDYHVADVRDTEQMSALIDTIVARHGRLDVLVNNVGGAPYALVQDSSAKLLGKLIELNLLAPLLVAQLANTVMQRQDGGGVIVNVSSVSGHRPSPGTAAYGAAKAGLDNLTQSLAIEWAPKVRVNSVICGMIRTELAHVHYGDEEGIAAVGRTVPLGRLAQPEEIGNCVAFLASPLASYVTGGVLVAHGGGEAPAFLSAANAAARANAKE